METLELKISIEKDKKTVENAVINYWEKTSKHLFLTSDKSFLKYIPIQLNGTWYVLRLKFNGKLNTCKVEKMYWDLSTTNDLIVMGRLKSAINNEVHFSKHHYDWQDGKKQSIKNFKAMKEAINKVIEYIIQTINTGNKIDTLVVADILKDMKYNK